MTEIDTRSNLTPLKLALAARETAEDALPWMRAEPIAAIGLGCRFPGASSPEAYRELLRSGTDATSELPADRWDRARYHDPDPDAAGRTYVTRGGYIEDPAHFDADFFGIGPREAASLDPQQRLLLETTWRALESAGIPPSSLYGRKVGVFFGVSSSEYTHVLDRHVATSDIDAYFGTGNARSAAAGRVSYVLGLQGPSLVVDTACSSSLVAVHLAVQSLRMRECDVALVGGVNLLFTPEPTINFAKARMLSPDGRCKVFDRRADGFARGEGCGVVVLKRLGDAIADEDSTLAIVRGSAVNQDGASSGLTAPRGPSQVAVLRAALDAAGVLPEQVAYVEAHGTGTELGDPVELGALEDVFGGPSREDDPLLLGSTKANIGHLESAAGIAGFIKAVLALHHDELFSQIHFEEPTPKIDWASSGLEVVTRPRSFPAREGRKLAGVSSFGFSGTNAHVVLEAFDGRALAPAEPKPRHLLMISAKTEDALEAMAQQCAQALDDGEAAAALCRTAAVGRSQFGHRLAVSGRDVDALVAALRAPEKAPERTPARRGRVSTRRSPVVAFMFSGQGAQWTGMGAELYEREPAFAQAMSQCRDIMHDHVSDRVRALLEGRGAGDVEHTADAQPALFAYEYALGCVFRAWGVEPSFVIGHSLGEITAACFSGILGLEDAARLVIERGRCMADGSPSGTPSGQPTGTQPRGKMVALQADPEQIVALAQPRRDRLSIAAINGPQQVVVSGYEADVDEFVASVPHAAARPLSVSHAFHSPLMDGALAPFREVVGRLRFRTPNIPLVSNVSGELAGTEIASPDYWVRHLRRTIRFADGIDTLWREGTQVFLEVGPSPSLSRLAAACVRDPEVTCVASASARSSEWETLLDAVGQIYVRGVDVDARALFGPPALGLTPVPRHPFRHERIWPSMALPRRMPVDVGSTLDKDADPARWGYVPCWVRSGPRLSAAVPAGAERTTTMIVAGRDEDARADARRLAAALQDAAVQTAVIDPDPEPLASALEGAPTRAVIVGKDGYDMLLSLARAWSLRASPERELDVVVITRGACDVIGSETLDPRAATVHGAALVVPQEHPRLRCRTVDLLRVSEHRAPHALAGEIRRTADEILAPRGDVAVALRGPHRFVLDYASSPLGEVPASGSRLRREGVYAIVGRLHYGLGARLARYLHERVGARVAFVGPSEPTALAELRDAGVTILHCEARVDDASAMRSAFEGIEAKWGRVDGVFHTSWMGRPDHARLSHQIDAEHTQQWFTDRVDGLQNLARVLEGREPDFCLVQSSLSGVVGGVGFSAYAAANAFVDAFVTAASRRASFPWLSVGWEAYAGAEVTHVPGLERTAAGAEMLRVSLTDDDVAVALDRLLVDLLSRGRQGTLCICPSDLGERRARAIAPRPTVTARGSTERDGGALGVQYEAPRDELEQSLVQIWEEFLPVRPIGVHDDYFTLGGTSLTAVQILARIKQTYHVEVPLASLLGGTPTIDHVGRTIRELTQGDDEVEALLAMMEGLSPEEAQRMLDETSGA